MNEWETCIDEWAGRLREANATIADLQGQVQTAQAKLVDYETKTYCAFCGQTYLIDTGAELIARHIKECSKHPMRDVEQRVAQLEQQAETYMKAAKSSHDGHLQSVAYAKSLEDRVAQLEGALERVANVPVDGDGRDYYWEGRDIAKQAIGKPTSERYTLLQADHARVLELVQEIKEAFDGDVHQCERCGEADPLNTFDIYRTVCEAASLPAQPAQGGANG